MTMIPADNIGKDGTIYKTVGENIRESSNLTPEKISSAVKNNTDRAKICDKLEITAETLKTALVALLSGKTAHFGGLDVDKLSSSEIAEIKKNLGIV